MYIPKENPVLQRELLTNLRMSRAFVLLFFMSRCWAAWCIWRGRSEQRLDLAQPAAKRLVNLFFSFSGSSCWRR